MRLTDVPVTDPRARLSEERADLIELLAALDHDDWMAPTESGHWSVKDVALHLLDDDLGWLSRGRDGDLSGLLSTDGDYRSFVAELDAKNERWVRGAAGLSSRVIVDILRWSGAQVDDHYANLDLAEDSSVIWASNSSTPRWFDLCRDFTERWVHQQHIRDAVRQPGSHDRFLPLVLRTFVWAFPHQYRAQAPEGTAVGVDLDVGGEWVLVRRPDHWSLEAGPTDSPEAAIRILAPVAWRQLTGQPVEPENITIEGPAHLIRELLEVRGIIV